MRHHPIVAQLIFLRTSQNPGSKFQGYVSLVGCYCPITHGARGDGGRTGGGDPDSMGR